MGTYRAASPVVVRSASLPAAALDGLRCDAAAKLVDVLLAGQRWSDAEGRALADLLHPVIGAVTDPAHRPRLIGLRRALHAGRMPARQEWNPQLADLLDPTLVERIEGWLAHRAGRSTRRDELAGVLSAETQRGLERMREALTEPAFRHAVAHASPVLAGELDKWLADPARTPRRRTVIGLTRYLSRAATKTSPFSTFTTVAVGGWCDDGPAVEFRPTGEACVVLELDVRLVQRLSAAVTGRPPLLRINPSVRCSADEVAFLGPGQGEPLVTIALVPAVREVLRIVGRDEPAPRDGVCAELARSAGEDLDRAASFVTRLEQAGLLETVAPPPDQAQRPIGALAESAGAGGGLLATLQQQLSTPGRSSEDHCATVAATAVRVFEQVGLSAPDPQQLQQSGLHETYLRPGAAVRCGRSRWRQALDDLDVVRRLLGVYDPGLPYRLALGSYCRLRFGPGATVGLLTLHRAMQTDLRDLPSCLAPQDADLLAPLRPGFLAGPDPLAGNRVPRLRRVRELRREALRVLTRGLDDKTGDDKTGEGGTGEGGTGEGRTVYTEPATVARLVESWPEWVGRPASMTCYVQPIPGSGPVRLVLAAAHGGHGRGRSRWQRLAGGVGTVDPGPEPGGAVTAELGGSFGTNLNLRVATAPYEISYPRAVSARPPEERIGLGSLSVRHDPDTDLVSLWAPEFPVVPVHGGMMSDALLPPVAQLLVSGFGLGYLTHPTLPALERPPSNPDAPGRTPRIDIGHITVRRARWTMPAAAVPLREPGEADVGYFIRLHSWLRTHELPQTCFVRCWDPHIPRERVAFDQSHKPLYIDFTSWSLVQVFEHLVAPHSGPVELAEALPDPSSFRSGTEYGANVHELLIEVSDN
ncbi:MAG: lantibiotic dehydratase [Pseudonocardiaceae bacterium]